MSEIAAFCSSVPETTSEPSFSKRSGFLGAFLSSPTDATTPPVHPGLPAVFLRKVFDFDTISLSWNDDERAREFFHDVCSKAERRAR